MTTGIYILHKPFDILDAAVFEYLPGFGGGWVDFEREEATHGSVVYRLSQDQLGDLGTIKLRKLGDDLSELSVDGPPRPAGRSRTDEEKAASRAIEDRAERIKAELAVLDKIRAECEQLYHQRESHQAKVIALMFQRMQEDDLVLEAKPAGYSQRRGPEGARMFQEEPPMAFDDLTDNQRQIVVTLVEELALGTYGSEFYAHNAYGRGWHFDFLGEGEKKEIGGVAGEVKVAETDLHALASAGYIMLLQKNVSSYACSLKPKAHQQYDLFNQPRPAMPTPSMDGVAEVEQIIKPAKPARPNKNASREEWFAYKRACGKAGTKFTHNDLAKELCLSPGHVRNLYATWAAGEETLQDT
jgi:hypothetical protein